MDGLTERQREAVEHMDGPALVLAGPGSGKTRVITCRVANLVANGVPAWSILALTFTNKAAGEMRERIDALVPHNVPGRKGLTVSTFHSLCARLLRRYAPQAGLPETYSIYDSTDQRSALKQALKQCGMDSKNWTPAAVKAQISNAKNQLIDHEEYARQASDFYTRSIAQAYAAYQNILKQAGALDFDDLLLNIARLLRDNDDVRADLQERYQYLLIDEYQDTNHVQFVIAHTLAAAGRNIFVVGDPDQSIYGWRGADLRNILDFETHYPDAVVIPLGENFRSTKHIVALADGLIRRNRLRKHKDLYTSNEEGLKPQLVRCADEHHEAQVVVDELRRHREEGMAWNDMAVMYRVNALSRVMEQALRNANVPYVIARGTAFYDRQEIKDALAYLRVLANPADEISLRRIINTPTRGIGRTSIERLELHAYNHHLTLLEAARNAANIDGPTPRAAKAITQFVAMLDSWWTRMQEESNSADEAMLVSEGDNVSDLASTVEMVIRESGLESMYRQSKSEEDHERVENLEELVSSAAQFVPPLELGPEPSPRQELMAYLESIALVSDADMVDPANGAVTLMTLHAAKGLEFPVVCMIGLEEGLLPHSNASASEHELEEERRLCYVGITRAESRLLLSSARRRTHRGVRERTLPSSFLSELPAEHLAAADLSDEGCYDAYEGADPPHAPVDEWIESKPPEGGRPAPGRSASPRSRFAVGMLVRHPQFGVGRIAHVEPGRDHTRAKVAFTAVGTKTLILEYARLEKVGE